MSRSQCPCGLRRRSAAVCQLRLCVQIPPGAWIFVVWVVCCQVKVSAMNWSLIHRNPTDGSALCVITKPHEWGGHSSCWAAEPEKIIILTCDTNYCSLTGRKRQGPDRYLCTVGFTVISLIFSSLELIPRLWIILDMQYITQFDRTAHHNVYCHSTHRIQRNKRL
jgi:hypothetical protein